MLVGQDFFQENHLYHEVELLAPGCFLAVCDGMGGHSDGEKASAFACSELLAAAETEMPETSNDIEHLLYTIQQNAEADLSGNSGTTIAGVLLRDTSITVFNAGDSRVYTYDTDTIRCISHDHSYVQEMIDTGAISAEEAFTHPYRNLVSFGIGPAFQDLWGKHQPFIMEYPIDSPTRLLLCSDGVSDLYPDHQLHQILTRSVEAPGKALLEALSEKGLKDNTSFILAEIHP